MNKWYNISIYPLKCTLEYDLKEGILHMDLIYLSTLFVAIAFALVVGYLCFILKRVTNTMKTLGSTMGEVEKQLTYITPQLTETIRGTGKLIEDVEEKVGATDTVFDSVEEFGISIRSANDAFNNRFGEMTDDEMDQKVKPFIEGIKWSEVGLRLYSNWKENKPSKKNEIMIRDQHDIVKVTGREE